MLNQQRFHPEWRLPVICIDFIHFVDPSLGDWLGSPADQESKTALPAIDQGVRGRQQLWQRVHSAPAGPLAATQTLHPHCGAAGGLCRLWLLRSSWLKRQRSWRKDIQMCCKYFYHRWKAVPLTSLFTETPSRPTLPSLTYILTFLMYMFISFFPNCTDNLSEPLQAFCNRDRFSLALWPSPLLFTVFIPQRYTISRHFYAPLWQALLTAFTF